MKWGRSRPASCLVMPVTIWERWWFDDGDGGGDGGEDDGDDDGGEDDD